MTERLAGAVNRLGWNRPDEGPASSSAQMFDVVRVSAHPIAFGKTLALHIRPRRVATPYS